MKVRKEAQKYVLDTSCIAGAVNTGELLLSCTVGLGSTGNFYLRLLRQDGCAIIAIIAMSGKRYFRNKICYQSNLLNLVYYYGPTISKHVIAASSLISVSVL